MASPKPPLVPPSTTVNTAISTAPPSESPSESTSPAASTPATPATVVDGPTPAPEDTNIIPSKLDFLLKQSSVYVNLLQEKLQENKRRKTAEAAKSKTAEAAKKPPALPPAPSTRATRRSTAAAAAAAAAAPKKRGRQPKVKADSKMGAYFSGTSAAAALEAAVEEGSRLGEHKGLRSADQPALITGGVMKDYQLEGLEWLVSLYENGLNGILADEMGLGKTLQTISLLAFLREKNVWGPFLVVGPVSVLASWVDEIARWAPAIPALLYHGTPAERAELRRTRMTGKEGPGFPVVCTNYELVMNDKKFLTKYNWKFVIIDEGHRLKNMNCKLVQELKSYTSANRLLLTGTPLQNNLAELWSLLNFLLPDIFDEYATFEDHFDFSRLQDKDQESHAAFLQEEKKNNLAGKLHALLKPFLLRRVKTDVEKFLPPKKEYVLYAPLSKCQKDLYGALLNHRAPEWLSERIMQKQGVDPGKKRKLELVDLTLGADMPDVPDGKKRRRTTVSANYRELEDDEYFEQLETTVTPELEAVEAPSDYDKTLMQASTSRRLAPLSSIADARQCDRLAPRNCRI